MVRFSKVITKSLASGTGSSESNEFGQDLVFSGVKSGSTLVCRPSTLHPGT